MDTPATDYPNTFRLIDDGDIPTEGQKKYIKINEEKNFAGHELDHVYYIFDDVGFVSAELDVTTGPRFSSR